MRSLILRYLLIAWSVVWFAVVVPGHQRGAILLPRADLYAANAPNQPMFESSTPVCCQVKDKSAGSRPAAPLGKGCAICDQTAKLTQVPHYDDESLFLGFQRLASPPAIFTLSGVQFILPSDARGPPSA